MKTFLRTGGRLVYCEPEIVVDLDGMEGRQILLRIHDGIKLRYRVEIFSGGG